MYIRKSANTVQNKYCSADMKSKIIYLVETNVTKFSLKLFPISQRLETCPIDSKRFSPKYMTNKKENVLCLK